MRNKRRIVVALYHRDRLSLGDNRTRLQHKAYHWAIMIMPKSPKQHNNCNVYDATDTAMIDPDTREDLNPGSNWRFRAQHHIDPSATGRLIGRIIVGKLPKHIEDSFVDELLRNVPLPDKEASPPQSCVTWAFDALSLLQDYGFARQFDLDQFRNWAVAYGDRCMETMSPDNILPQNLPALWGKRNSSYQYELKTRAIDEKIEEETLKGDRLKYFHPTRPNEALNGRFKTIAKLGYGSSSIVWLAENLKFSKWKRSPIPRYVSVKIAALDTHVSREPANAKIIAHANSQHEGLSFTHFPGDEFQLQGPQGTHSCLVYEPMRETLYQFQRRVPQQKLPLPLFKLYIYCLLEAVDYLHTECHLIHTDIKDDNVMVTFEDEEVLEDFMKQQKNAPQTQHVRPQDGRATFLSQGDFGPLRGTRILPRLADFNLCFPSLEGRAHISAVQSHRYRAPEVLLGCPWTSSLDIWNFGLFMWDLLEDASLFRPAGADDEYDAHVHLAQMVRLLGEPPVELIQRERQLRELKLQGPILNFRNEECDSMDKFWGGPFFDDSGRLKILSTLINKLSDLNKYRKLTVGILTDKILRKDLLGDGENLESTVTQTDGDDKAQFLDMAGSMLEWMPEKRETAKELLGHQFFDSLNKDRERDG